MAEHRDDYWTLIEVERQLRNALSIVREAEHLLMESTSLRTAVSDVAENMADAVALAAASRRRALEADRVTQPAA
jgi:hypothetical protein